MKAYGFDKIMKIIWRRLQNKQLRDGNVELNKRRIN